MNPDLVERLNDARVRYYNKMRNADDPSEWRFWKRHAQQVELALRGGE